MSLAFYKDAGQVFDAVFKDRMGLKAVLYNRGLDTRKLAVIKAVVCKTLAVGKPLRAAIRKVDASILKRDHGMMLCICHDLLSGSFRGGGQRVRPLRLALDAIREILGQDILAKIASSSTRAVANSSLPVSCNADVSLTFSYFRLNPAFIMQMSSEFPATKVLEDLEKQAMRQLVESVTTSNKCAQSLGQDNPGATERRRRRHPLSGCIAADEYVPGCYRIETRHVPALLEHQRQGHIVIQDRSSQFSAHAVLQEVEALLARGQSSITVLDACAAPGSKTSHVFHMLQSLLIRLQWSKTRPGTSDLPRFRLVAVEKDEERFCILVRRLQQLCGPLWLRESDVDIPGNLIGQRKREHFDIDKFLGIAQSHDEGDGRGKDKTGKKRARRALLPRQHWQVVTGQTRLVFHVPLCHGTCEGVSLELIALCKDFRKLDAQDVDGHDVDVLVLDPSCSGSGLSEHAVASSNESHSNNCLQKRCAAAVDAKRLKALTDFQTNILTHALTAFPVLHACCYSTCSIFREENELVVLRALGQALEQGWESTYPFSFKWPEKTNTSRAACETDAEASMGASNLPVLATYQQLRSQSAHSVPEEHQCRGFYLAKLVRKSVDSRADAATKHKALAEALLPYSIQLYDQSDEDFTRALMCGELPVHGAAEYASLASTGDADGSSLKPKSKKKRKRCSAGRLQDKLSTDGASVTAPSPHISTMAKQRKKEKKGIVIRR